jgi:hypothetical protein
LNGARNAEELRGVNCICYGRDQRLKLEDDVLTAGPRCQCAGEGEMDTVSGLELAGRGLFLAVGRFAPPGPFILFPFHFSFSLFIFYFLISSITFAFQNQTRSNQLQKFSKIKNNILKQ